MLDRPEIRDEAAGDVAGGIHVAIIGAGMSGLYTAAMLKRRGIAYTIYEKADEIGGTWRDNRYPGLFIDVLIGIYQLDIAPKYDWSHPFASGPEIQEYLLKFVKDFDLRRDVRFGVEITDVSWDGKGWMLREANGGIERADVVVCATGFLHQVVLPKIPGMESFKGPAFHSARWPQTLDLRGKKIGIIGTGSSGIQLVSALAFEDCQVTQFIRTPQWVWTTRNPPASIFMRLIARHIPGMGMRVLRRMEASCKLDPRLTDIGWKLKPGRLRDDAQQALRESLLAIRDPELRRKMTPDFPPGCKRLPKSPHYYEAIQRPNVEIVRGSIERIEPTGVVMEDGSHHELDVLVYATGFDAHAYMRPMTVVGENGTRLDDVWKDGPFAYKNVSVPLFPNFYVLHGPFAPVNDLSPPITIVHQTSYICRLIEIVQSQRCAIAPTREATEKFCQWVEAAVPDTVWASGCGNWYKGKGGKAVLWPWHKSEYTEMFRELSLEDLVLSPLGAAAQRTGA